MSLVRTQSINGSLKFAYFTAIFTFEAFKLCHMHFLGLISIEESHLHIHLPYLIIIMSSNGYQYSYVFKHGYWTKSLVIVNSLSLTITFSYKSSLIGNVKNISFDGYIGTWILRIYQVYRRYIGGYCYMNIDISEINKNTLKIMEILCKSVKMALIMKYTH